LSQLQYVIILVMELFLRFVGLWNFSDYLSSSNDLLCVGWLLNLNTNYLTSDYLLMGAEGVSLQIEFDRNSVNLVLRTGILTLTVNTTPRMGACRIF